MKPNAYKLLERCVEDGVELGYNRAMKHSDNNQIDEYQLREEIFSAVLQEICEWFSFDAEQ